MSCEYCRLGDAENQPCQYGGNPNNCEFIKRIDSLKAVNEQLVKRNEFLEEIDGDIERVTRKNNGLMLENQRLGRVELALLKTIDELEVKVLEREKSLKECNPYVYEDNIQDYLCYDCRKFIGDGHKDDCLYVRLCGGVKDETR